MGLDTSPKMHFVAKSDAGGIGALKASDFLDSAANQLQPEPGRPLESDLRRAMSTTYYALFHCLAVCCTDTLIGKGAVRIP